MELMLEGELPQSRQRKGTSTMTEHLPTEETVDGRASLKKKTLREKHPRRIHISIRQKG